MIKGRKIYWQKGGVPIEVLMLQLEVLSFDPVHFPWNWLCYDQRAPDNTSNVKDLQNIRIVT